MPKFEVLITETLSKSVIVESDKVRKITCMKLLIFLTRSIIFQILRQDSLIKFLYKLH